MLLNLQKGTPVLAAAVPFLHQPQNTRKGDHMMEELMPLIANLGFPIVVSLYLLIRVERKLEEMAGCIKEVNRSISKLL
jgi:hypothetical protein